MLRPGGGVRCRMGEGGWVGYSFLRTMGLPLFLPPPLTRHSHMQAVGGAARERAGSAARGCSWLAPGLALLKAKAVNSALLKMSNKGEKKRKEKEKCGGDTGWEWGRRGLREQVGTI